MRSGGNIDFVIDLESSTNTAIENGKIVGEGKNFLNKVWSGLVGCDRSNRCEEAVSFENRLHNCAEVRLENGEALVVDKKVGRDEKVVGAEKPKKKSCKKPPRPPRPLSLDSADLKLIREISELAMLKRARVERMKALKKIKNGKSASFSAGNTFALVITLIFCIVIIWQGVVFRRGSSTTAFLGSPQSSMGTSSSSSRFITIQFYSNASTNAKSS